MMSPIKIDLGPSRKMFRFCCFICFVLTYVATATAQETRIAAVVNDDIISLADLEARVRLVLISSNLEDSQQTRQRIVPQVLRTMIDEKLEMQEAKHLNIKPTDAELQTSIERLETQNKMPKGGLETYLKERGVNPSTLTDQLNASIAWGKVVRSKLARSVAVSDEEIDDALAAIKESTDLAQNRVAEIFLAVDDPRQEDEVRRLADRLVDQLRQGSNFQAIAQQFSQSATAAVGGDMGWVNATQMPPDVAKTVEQMHPGELSTPVRAPGGYYIIYLIERRTPSRAGAADTKVSLVQVMFPVPTPADRDTATAAAKEVSDTAKSCGEMLKIGHDRAPSTSGDLGQLKVVDLPAELQSTVLSLPVGQASQPVPLRGGIGVLMVCEREAPPSAEPSREEVSESISRQRLDNLARRYLRDLRRTAYIDVRA
jgi:peptidyl-prolyl cis-trans isomerase SurA